MSSPKQRIQRLKKEIADLDQKMTKINTSQKKLSLPLDNILAENSEKNELKHSVSSYRLSTNREQVLVTQLAEIQTKLKVLAGKKQVEVAKSKQERESYKSVISRLKQNLQKLYDESQYLSASLSEKKRIRENLAVAKSKAYSESLEPLESDIKDLLAAQSKLDLKHAELQREKKQTENLAKMCSEEIETRQFLRGDLVAQKEELESYQDIFFEDFSDELKYLRTSTNVFEELNKTTSLQQKYREEVCSLESIVDLQAFSTEKLKLALGVINKDLHGLLFASSETRLNSELQSLEDLLREKSMQLGVDSLEPLILEQNSLEKFDIDEEILKLQLAEMRAAEVQLRQEFEYEEKMFSEQLIICQYKGASTEELTENYQRKKKIFRNKLAAISQWKEEVEEIVVEQNLKARSLTKDASILEEFGMVLNKVNSQEGKKELDEAFSRYLVVLAKREKIIQNFGFQIKEKYSEKIKLSEKIAQANKDKLKTLIDLIRAKQQVQVLIQRENSLKSESKSLNESILISSFFHLKSSKSQCEISIFSQGKQLDLLKSLYSHYWSSVKSLRSEKKIIKLAKKELSEEIKATSYQIEKLNDKKQKTNSNFQDQEEEKLQGLQIKIEEISSEYNTVCKELTSFEQDYQLKLGFIEQEESMLRSQQQALESALKNIELETKRIKDTESLLFSRPEDAEAAPTPESLKESRSKSALKQKLMKSEDFYTGEIKDGNEVSSINKKNSYFELAVKSLGRQASLTGDKMATPPRASFNKRYYRFNLEDISQVEVSFLEKIRPLLEGCEIYKRLNLKLSKMQNFDPLEGKSPETSGYAIRQFFLHKSLSRIDVRQPLKPGFETTINTENMMPPILSPTIINILKLQNHLQSGDLDCEKYKDTGPNESSSDFMISRCRDIILYPFCISVVQGEKLDLVAKSYQDFKHWINGINALIKYKRFIPKLRSRIESYTSV